MRNPATHMRQDQLNAFTKVIAEDMMYGGLSTLVRLRNNTIVEVTYKPAQYETEEDIFLTADYEYVWNLDGTSVTNRNYDMMELINV